VLARTRALLAEHGPAVPLSRIAAAVGLSAPALVRRFGSKEGLLFLALLPDGPPRWWTTLHAPPPADPQPTLVRLLAELAEDFEAVGPALAALRTSGLAVDAVFPADHPGPPRAAREALARWLEAAGVQGPADVLADLAAGAAEARGFFTWVGAPMVDDAPHRAWAERVATHLLARR